MHQSDYLSAERLEVNRWYRLGRSTTVLSTGLRNPSNRKGLLQKFILAAILNVTLLVPLMAEVPEWNELRDSLLFMRQHFLVRSDTGLEQHLVDGIWRLPADGASLIRERPFFANANAIGLSGMRFRGEQGFLTTKADRVLFQSWPVEVHFDALSWRMINRLPVEHGLGGGWALQGPYLEADAVDGTGLDPGVYGVARCVWSIITNTWRGYQECAARTIPGTAESTSTTNASVLLHHAQSPGFIDSAVPTFVFPNMGYQGNDVLLSFNPEEQGFWRGTQLGAQFFPVVDGQLQVPTLDVDLSNLPFGLSHEEGFLSALYYHPGQHRLFGNVHRIPYTSTHRDQVFFGLDPLTGEAEDFGSLVGDMLPPFTFTSFENIPDVHEQIIPIAAETSGEKGTFWTTDLWLYNPSSATSDVTISRLVSSTEVTIELSPHASRRIDNVLGFLGGGVSGDGVTHDALHVSSPFHWGEQVVAVARVWTTDGITGGTFGHTVPSVPSPYGFSNHNVLSDGQVSRLGHEAHIDLDLRVPGRFRHNIGIVNTHDEELFVDLVWTYKEDTLTLFWNFFPLALTEDHRTTVTVPPKSIRLFNVENLFPPDIVTGWVPRIGVFSQKPAIIWFSMVDNLTGDATFAPFTNFSDLAAEAWSENLPPFFEEYMMAIPAVAHNEGREQSHWKTDLFGYLNRLRTGRESSPFAVFYPTKPGDCSTDQEGEEISGFIDSVLAMPAEQWQETVGFPPQDEEAYTVPFRTIFPDVIRLFAKCANVENAQGGLEILAGSWFSGFSRTYTTREDGGTYGAMMPLYPPNGLPVQHFAGLELNEQTRINIGFFNGDHDHAITHLVTLFDGDGTKVAERSFTLESMASKQQAIQNFFTGVDLQSGTYGLTVLPLDQEPSDENPGFQGHSWAYVSVIDNLTNDPINLW